MVTNLGQFAVELCKYQGENNHLFTDKDLIYPREFFGKKLLYLLKLSQVSKEKYQTDIWMDLSHTTNGQKLIVMQCAIDLSK